MILLIFAGSLGILALTPGCSSGGAPSESAKVVVANTDSDAATADPADVTALEQSTSDYPWWRGPTRDGVAVNGQKPPLAWSESQNVVWKQPVRGHGHATPVIVGDRIFVHTATETDDLVTNSLIGYSRKSGDQLFDVELHRGKPIGMHGDNSHASSTPACDGNRIFCTLAADDAIYLTATDLDGKPVWKEKVAGFISRHGFDSSPVLYKSLVIAVSDSIEPQESFLTALDRETGEVVWQARRPLLDASYSSPIVLHTSGKDQLLLIGPEQTDSYDPNSGELLWSCEGPTKVGAATAIADDENVYITAGYPRRKLMCIRSDGSGDVTDTHVKWELDREIRAAYVPSLIMVGDLLFSVSDEGTIYCLDKSDGTVFWSEKLGEKFYSSPVLVDDRIYIFGREGGGWVFQASKEKKLLAENQVDNGVWATPVFLDNGIYLRTLDSLYFIAE